MKGQFYTMEDYHGLLRVMKDICEKAVDINTAVCRKGGRTNRTPIYIEIRRGRKDLVEFLIGRGLKISAAQQVKVEKIMEAAQYST